MDQGRFAVVAAAALAAACGGSYSAPSGGTDAGTVTTTGADGGTTPTSFELHIKGMAFSPENLTVPAGATVQVVNDDGSVPHSVTSEATAGAYVPGSVAGISFDTGIFTGTRSFTLPASAATGTVIPYFCRVHGAMMVDAAKVQLTIGPAGTAPVTPTTTPAPTMPPSPGGY
ncbi:plastocyanin/azurin family copper-binding protein [Anaeromyxobacter diazotrophicus]|uniref:Blue (type 1) copper domain-containing protein n=1 Tax=Anaeromyxobacter diazotrophicus TaxID=2590199 RepID=A0A7I9VI39_9BACT|nr:plastocyanin/azurin family copper-binding protein [Anaeromyxobacter diazotrophicus]GEJ55780.1 hypothetical protein AMYX_05210 [Anaeromyxobacter diazotrophicus]